MMRVFSLWVFSVCVGLAFSMPGFATQQQALDEVIQLQTRWAEIKYQLPEKQHEDEFSRLADKANAAVKQYPEVAELLIWRGIVLSTFAGESGGLSALGLVDDARDSFDRALSINDAALSGSAYTSLGALYYQVPGWPLSFGSSDKAREFLQKALEINPDGIDANFFYADYLVSEDQYDEARKVLNHALKAAPRPGRELADKGRRGEIDILLKKIDGKHSS